MLQKIQGWAIALSLFRSLLFSSFQKEQQGAIRTFTLFHKSKKERFALLLFTKRAKKSDLLFGTLLVKSERANCSFSLFLKRTKERIAPWHSFLKELKSKERKSERAIAQP